MNLGPAVDQLAGFASQLGHQVLVDVLGAVDVPDQHGEHRVGGDSNGHRDERKPPDLDVVREENRDRAAHDCEQPYSERVHALGIFHAVRNGQPEGPREFLFFLERPCDQFRSLSRQLIDQADRFDFHEVGHADRQRHRDESDVHSQARGLGPGRTASERPEKRVFEGHDRHHDHECGRMQIFVRELPDSERRIVRHAASPVVETRESRNVVHDPYSHEKQPERQGSDLAGRQFRVRRRHLSPGKGTPGG